MTPHLHVSVFLSIIGLLLPAGSASAQAAAPSALDLSLEELMQVVVTSVAKKPQVLAETAAAIYVIHAEDIRRSGATNIPEALRLAPGIQVAALGSNKWAVSIRGQADRFSNKLLVLVDGRSVYSLFFSGVIWENLAVPLANIERIEVLRGPGASIWGSNAVNGVINIITRSAFAHPGSLITLTAGSELRASLLARLGWQPTPETAAQIHLEAQSTDASRPIDSSAGVDAWRNYHAGFRLDRAAGPMQFQLQGGVYTVDAQDEIFIPALDFNRLARGTQATQGGHLLGRWERHIASGQRHSLQTYLEYSDYDHIPVAERRTTLDLEYQRQLEMTPYHSRIWGLGYRQSQDKIVGSTLVELPDAARTLELASFYLQDDIVLQPERWRLVLGARLEHADAIGFNFQPNARLLWTPDTQTSAWLSLARANRTPSRFEQGGILTVPTGLQSALQLDNGQSQEEQLDALDWGWRQQLSPQLSLDLAAFYYRYQDLRDAVVTGVNVLPSGYTLIQTENRNTHQGKAYGFEAVLDWRPQPHWRVQTAYSWLDTEIELGVGTLGSSYADTTPQHQLSLRAEHELSTTLRWDAWLRYVGAVPLHAIPAYATLDMRLAWQPRSDLELALVGQNIFDDAHPEFGSSFILSTPSEIERRFYVQLRWNFD